MRFFAQVVACRAGVGVAGPGSLLTCAEPPACQGRFLAGGGGAGCACAQLSAGEDRSVQVVTRPGRGTPRISPSSVTDQAAVWSQPGHLSLGSGSKQRNWR